VLRWEKVCISNDPKDDELADIVSRSLTKLSLEIPLSHDRNGLEIYYPNRNENIELTRNQIKDSNCFITVITENSRGSQSMKQELDFALADSDLGVFPLVEMGETIEPNEYTAYITEFERDNIDDAIYRLISALRQYLDRTVTIVKHVIVICKRCGYVYRVKIPSQDEIDDMVSKNEVYHTECKCRTINKLIPKTFEVSKS
jgi:hypothetical protein